MHLEALRAQTARLMQLDRVIFTAIVFNPTSVKKKRARTLYPPIEASYSSCRALGFPEALTQRGGFVAPSLQLPALAERRDRDSSFALRDRFSEATRLPARDSG